MASAAPHLATPGRVARVSLPAALLLAACSGLLGCGGGKVVPTTVWRLRSAGDAAPTTGASRTEGLRLGVGRFSSLAELRTTALVWRSDEGRQVHRYPHEEWADYPDRMLEEMALSALARHERVALVARTPPARGLDGVLGCRVTDFSEWSDQDHLRVRVAVSWRVEDPTDQSVLGGGIVTEEAEVTEKSASGVVDAFERATRVVADRLASEAVTACASPTRAR